MVEKKTEVQKPVHADDVTSTVLAALSRAEKVPASETLIDRISDDDWVDLDVHKWDICAGSADHDDQELDEFDAETPSAA